MSTSVTRRRFLHVIALASGGSLLAACAQPAAPAAQKPAPAAQPTAAPAKPAAQQAAPAAAAKPSGQAVELVLGHFVPTKHEMHARFMEPWAKEVEQKSGGGIKITIHPGGALGPAPAQYKNVAAGAMDLGFGLQGYTPGRFPLTEAVELPFLWGSGEEATKALWKLMGEFPAMREEYADTHLLALWTHAPADLLMTKQPVKTLADFKGQKLRSPGAMQNKMIEALGATPLSAPVSELYDILERGVANGAVITPSAFIGFNLAEVVKHTTKAGFYVSPFFLTMNKEKWESLSAEHKKLLTETSGEPLSLKAARVYEQTDEEGTELAKQKGVTFYTPPAEELAKWKAATANLAEQWVKDTAAKGLPAKAFYDQMLQLAKA